jgi:hypothetical protein
MRATRAARQGQPARRPRRLPGSMKVPPFLPALPAAALLILVALTSSCAVTTGPDGTRRSTGDPASISALAEVVRSFRPAAPAPSAK